MLFLFYLHFNHLEHQHCGQISSEMKMEAAWGTRMRGCFECGSSYWLEAQRSLCPERWNPYRDSNLRLARGRKEPKGHGLERMRDCEADMRANVNYNLPEVRKEREEGPSLERMRDWEADMREWWWRLLPASRSAPSLRGISPLPSWLNKQNFRRSAWVKVWWCYHGFGADTSFPSRILIIPLFNRKNDNVLKSRLSPLYKTW